MGKVEYYTPPENIEDEPNKYLRLYAAINEDFRKKEEEERRIADEKEREAHERYMASIRWTPEKLALHERRETFRRGIREILDQITDGYNSVVEGYEAGALTEADFKSRAAFFELHILAAGYYPSEEMMDLDKIQEFATNDELLFAEVERMRKVIQRHKWEIPGFSEAWERQNEEVLAEISRNSQAACNHAYYEELLEYVHNAEQNLVATYADFPPEAARAWIAEYEKKLEEMGGFK